MKDMKVSELIEVLTLFRSLSPENQQLVLAVVRRMTASNVALPKQKR